MYVLYLLLVLNGQVIDEKRGARYENFIDCVQMGERLMQTKPKDLNVVFQCRDADLNKRTM